MSEAEIFKAKVDAELDQHEEEILLCQKALIQFIDSEHGSEDVKEMLKQIHGRQSDLIDVSRELLKLKSNPAFSGIVRPLMRRCNELRISLSDSEKQLREDKVAREAEEAQKKKSESKEKIDLVKVVGFFVAVPAAMVAAVKNGVGTKYISPEQAGLIGLAISSSALLHKPIFSLFAFSKQAICDVEKRLRYSLVYENDHGKLRNRAPKVENGIRGVQHKVVLRLDKVANKIGSILTSNSILLVEHPDQGGPIRDALVYQMQKCVKNGPAIL